MYRFGTVRLRRRNLNRLTARRWVHCESIQSHVLWDGGRDPNPERDGIAGMKRTASWLPEQGAVIIEVIEDRDSGHGAFHLNPKNALRVLN